MKNIEKYGEKFFNELLDSMYGRDCRKILKELVKLDCNEDVDDCCECGEKLYKFFMAEYKEPIKLTKAEKIILENLDKRFTWIAKPKNAYAKAYQLKPVREENEWNGYSLPMSLIMFPNLFQFIRWEDKPLEIKWLLENCEVIEE